MLKLLTALIASVALVAPASALGSPTPYPTSAVIAMDNQGLTDSQVRDLEYTAVSVVNGPLHSAYHTPYISFGYPSDYSVHVYNEDVPSPSTYYSQSFHNVFNFGGTYSPSAVIFNKGLTQKQTAILFTREIVEMVVNPYLDRTFPHSQTPLEVGDPVAGVSSYRVVGQPSADFVLPSWSTNGRAPYDAAHILKHPHQRIP